MEKTGRRLVLKTIGWFSIGSLLPLSGRSSDLSNKSELKIVDSEKKKPISNEIHTDILVIGGGTAGIIAALQSARAGYSTVVVENGSQLGGTMTTGGVAFPGLFHAWGKQVISGIGWELVTESVRLNDSQLPDFSIPTGRNHPRHQVSINAPLYAMLAEEKCLQSGVNIRYYETPVKLHFNDSHWEVETVGKGVHAKIICKQLIDCTGNAAVSSLAGMKVLRENETQPGTQMFEIGGYDINKLDINSIQSNFDEEVRMGTMLRTDARGGRIAAILHSGGPNSQHVLNADSSTSELHTKTNIAGRAAVLRMLRFLRRQPGCEKTHLVQLQQETAVRETFRIDGQYQITHQDYIEGRVFNDSLSYSFYPIDLHDPNGIIPRHLNEGIVPTVPLRALIPKNSKNFLVAGRCVSSDRLANSALRVQASCMGMGQVAGATAALAVKYKIAPIDVPIASIKELLIQHDAIVP